MKILGLFLFLVCNLEDSIHLTLFIKIIEQNQSFTSKTWCGNFLESLHMACGSYAKSFFGYAVIYLQANPGGITLYGWTVDRGLINTIFFIELTLVTFVLGKTVVFGSST